jgi:hypothetical protein
MSLPGIGTFSLRQNSSQLDFTNKRFTSPDYYFTLDTKNDMPSKIMFEWLSSSLGVTEWDAIRSVNDFSGSIKDTIAKSGEMTWDNIGIIKRDTTGNFKLEATTISLYQQMPVIAEKVIREKSEHTMIVGETEKSVIEMEEYFADQSSKRNYGWIVAVILTVLAVMFIGWHFSEKGFIPASAGNSSVIKSK